MTKTASCPELDKFQPITSDVLPRGAMYLSTTIDHLKHLRLLVQRLYPQEMSVLESQPAECDEITNAEAGSPPQPSCGPNLDPTPARRSGRAAAQNARPGTQIRWQWMLTILVVNQGGIREPEPFKNRALFVMALRHSLLLYYVIRCYCVTLMYLLSYLKKLKYFESEKLLISGCESATIQALC